MGILIFDWLILWNMGIVPDLPNLSPYWQIVQNSPLRFALAINAGLGLCMCALWFLLFLIGSRTDEFADFPVTTAEVRAELERWQKMDERWANIEICYAVFGILAMALIPLFDRWKLL